MISTEKLIEEMNSGILKWYDFQRDAAVLCVGECDAIVQMLISQNLNVSHISLRDSAKAEFLEAHVRLFDYVIVMEILETCYEPVKMLERWRYVLKQEGTLLLGVENRLGIRYFCGDRDPFTNRNFDGIENYRRNDCSNIKAMGGRCYARYEIEAMLNASGFHRRKFYSVLPDLRAAQLIYAENYLPNEELSIRYFGMYHCPDTVFLHEGFLFDSLIHNHMFHQMANAYLIECSDQREFANVKHVTLSTDRGVEQAIATIIRDNETVEKRPLYEQGREKLQQLEENTADLKAHGIPMIEAQLENGTYSMPYVNAPIGNKYMQDLLLQDKEEFIRQMDRIREIILKSSEHVEENALGIILKRGYLDLVPLNCFYIEDDFVFFDQEFYEKNCPANVILYRAILTIYDDITRQSMLPIEFFWKRYQMEEQLPVFHKMAMKFTDILKNKERLAEFDDTHRTNWQALDSNRAKVNDYKQIYQKQYVETCFYYTHNKKIIVFGSGKFADKFLAFYRNELSVSCIVDNSKEKWGMELYGIPVQSPDILKSIDPDEYKVIICVSQCGPIVKQLIRMGFSNIGVYDANYVYPGRQQLSLQESTEQVGKKKYHIGYIAGVFDLFHIGHLNMFRRAKEQCDYLIAAVVSDDGVRNNKKQEPFIPFEERIEMVRACKYVDEAVEIPYLYGGTVDAFQKYHFDCQFSGSDYINDPWWLEQKQYLEEHGAELVFFSYTEQTSSTKIKALIDKGLV